MQHDCVHEKHLKSRKTRKKREKERNKTEKKVSTLKKSVPNNNLIVLTEEERGKQKFAIKQNSLE